MENFVYQKKWFENLNDVDEKKFEELNKIEGLKIKFREEGKSQKIEKLKKIILCLRNGVCHWEDKKTKESKEDSNIDFSLEDSSREIKVITIKGNCYNYTTEVEVTFERIEVLKKIL